MNLQAIRGEIQRRKGARDSVLKNIKTTKQRIRELREKAHNIEEAKLIIQAVAYNTQNKLRFHINELSSLAMQAIFDNPYSIDIEFNTSKRKTEAKITFQRDGEKLNPLDATGGGPVDIAAFALRIAVWTLDKDPNKRPVFILDEPFKHLKGQAANEKAIQMVKEISKRLGIQFIIVSDERAARESIIEGADKVFETSIVNRVTTVKEITNKNNIS